MYLGFYFDYKGDIFGIMQMDRVLGEVNTQYAGTNTHAFVRTYEEGMETLRV